MINTEFAESTKRLSAILFDLDGTLLNSLGSLKNTFYEFLQNNGVDKSDDLFEKYNGCTIPQVVRGICDQFHLEARRETLVEHYKAAVLEHYLEAQPNSGAVELLELLAEEGLVMGLVTSSLEELIVPLMEKLGWCHFFRVVVTGDMVERTKPAADPYLLALEKMAIDPVCCLAVEDSTSGIISANSAGLFVVGVTTGGADAANLIDAGSSFTVSSLDELRDYIIGNYLNGR